MSGKRSIVGVNDRFGFPQATEGHGAILMKIDVHSHIEIADCFDRLAKGQGRASTHQLSAESAAINKRGCTPGIRPHSATPGKKSLTWKNSVWIGRSFPRRLFLSSL